MATHSKNPIRTFGIANLILTSLSNLSDDANHIEELKGESSRR
jgi:hypothetical protein